MDRVHHNLNTGRVSVLLHGKKKKIASEPHWVEVFDAVPRVQPKGRQACIDRATANGSVKTDHPTGRAVHAFIVGTVGKMGCPATLPDLNGLTRVRYNPFRRADFHTDDGVSWKGSARVICTGGYIYIGRGTK